MRTESYKVTSSPEKADVKYVCGCLMVQVSVVLIELLLIGEVM